MSRDGKGERISRKVGGPTPSVGPRVDCSGFLHTGATGRFAVCTLGHVHCTHCLKRARRFRKGWTCGICRRKR